MTLEEHIGHIHQLLLALPTNIISDITSVLISIPSFCHVTALFVLITVFWTLTMFISVISLRNYMPLVFTSDP